MSKIYLLVAFFAAFLGSLFLTTKFIYADTNFVPLYQEGEVKGVETSRLVEGGEEVTLPLEEILESQEINGVLPYNPLKFAIRNAVSSGVPINTIILLFLLPIVALAIATARQIIGIKGFGIFLPAALSVVFLATGPILGIFLFMVILGVGTFGRMILKQTHIRLQYLPRMALILWLVSFGVLGVLFAAPLVLKEITSVSIFPILFLILLMESFIGVQIGKSTHEAIIVTFETVVLALFSYMLLSWYDLRKLVLLEPEITLLTTAFLDWFMGRFSGLRVIEYFRFRKLITG